jgi:DNA adenine methylase
MAQPFLKWAGGKRQLLQTIHAHLPPEVKNGGKTRYIEPFVGGGAVFFYIRKHFAFSEFHISDLNQDLINAYLVVRDELPGLCSELEKISDEYLPLPHEDRALQFYETRDTYNSNRGCLENSEIGQERVIRAAQMIFMNRTCFNGLYRVNSRGDYNVPHGRYRNPKILNEENLESARIALSGVNISQGTYQNCEPSINDDSFVYLDPPYRPLPNTPSFTDYSEKSTFGDEDQSELADFFSSASDSGASLMLSNSDPHVTDRDDDFFDTLYSDFEIRRVPARRAINSDGNARGPITEILVTNY